MGGIGNISDSPAWLLLMALIFATVVGLLSGIAPANRAVKSSALAVSYTHLDVYKRQIQRL